jgi:hypothetical protein
MDTHEEVHMARGSVMDASEVAGALREADVRWFAWTDEVIAPYLGDPVRQLLALVDAVARAATKPDFDGDGFMATSAEIRDPDDPGKRAARGHLERRRACFEQLARDATVADPKALADMLMLIVGGTYANGAALGPEGPAREAVRAAEILIRTALI